MTLDNFIKTPNNNENIKHNIKCATIQNKSQFIFKYLFGLGLKDRDIQASLTLHKPENSDNYWMRNSDFGNNMVF